MASALAGVESLAAAIASMDADVADMASLADARQHRARSSQGPAAAATPHRNLPAPSGPSAYLSARITKLGSADAATPPDAAAPPPSAGDAGNALANAHAYVLELQTSVETAHVESIAAIEEAAKSAADARAAVSWPWAAAREKYTPWLYRTGDIAKRKEREAKLAQLRETCEGRQKKLGEAITAARQGFEEEPITLQIVPTLRAVPIFTLDVVRKNTVQVRSAIIPAVPPSTAPLTRTTPTPSSSSTRSERT